MDRGHAARTRQSYDTVAEAYASLTRDAVTEQPVLAAVLGMFAHLSRAAWQSDGPPPVLDIGCGPGHFAGHLDGLGLAVTGIDLSPGMIGIARRDHPGPRYAVGSMTALPCPDAAAIGALVSWSIIHVPDQQLDPVAGELRRVVQPGGIVAVGFHVGDRTNHRTEGYGGLPMDLDVHLRPVEVMSDLLQRHHFHIEATMLLDPGRATPGGVVLARRT
ncbi:methyltransferase domain-containing protein [Nakamurella sp. YIM 132087]|uniref:Methyltransferase domain-containing protein n=2 Tax=Nakamurella alba TaxID=2665158 RepID=A0A7K1FJ16_9ACTN|nr:methyltransferase domain-containing protein [Nakamurella alba]